MTPVDPEVLVAAGVLHAVGALDETLSSEAAGKRLTELFDDSTLWRRSDDGLAVRTPSSAMSPAPAATWTAPGRDLPSQTNTALREAWSQAVSVPHDHTVVVRLTLGDQADADHLDRLGQVGEVRLAPLIAKPASRFFWRWPMRIGVLDGPRASEWQTQIARSSHSGTLYDVWIVRPGEERDLEILVVDDEVDHELEGSSLRRSQAACVIVVGDARPVGLLLERAVDELDPAVAAGVRASDVRWFTEFIHELSHDQPVDVALALVAPDARVAGDPDLVNLTAVGRWTSAVVAEETERHAASPAVRHLEADRTAELASIVAHGDFTFESHAASQINSVTRPLVDTPGELFIERRMHTASAAPPAEEPTPAVARHLLADITSGDELCERALAPRTAHKLEVQIAIPRNASEGVPFNEAAVPDGVGLVHLQVAMTCPALGLRAQEPLDLPTADRSLPSSVAVFPFRTPADGALLAFEVLVLHQNRPIQEIRVMATVRAAPARRDRVQVVPVPLSAQPEPAVDATPADLALDARDGHVTSVATGDRIPVESGAVKALLDDIELRASRVLGAGTTTAWRAGEQAPTLLIELARLGSMLHRKLADVDDPKARSVSMLVRYDTAIIPIELAYAGPAPGPKARLCRHATRPPSVTQGKCPKASRSVVCPYAFWGMHRTIARTIEGRPKRARAARTMEPLRLRPVLYAAANIADKDLPKGTPAADHPSQLLQAALRDALGVDVARVTNWRTWRTQVRTVRPELLVVLGHTETINGESSLLIGKTSVLTQPEVTAALVASEGAPGPLVVLLACASGVAGDSFFGALPASFTDSGAAAVVATLSQLKGPDGARAAEAVIVALRNGGTSEGTTLGAALTTARRSLVKAGLLVGLVLVAHGEIDLKLTKD